MTTKHQRAVERRLDQLNRRPGRLARAWHTAVRAWENFESPAQWAMSITAAILALIAISGVAW